MENAKKNERKNSKELLMFVLYSFRLILLKKVFLKFAQLSLKDVFNIIRLETCYNKIIVFI
jgi:hypothetical protein